MILLSILKFPGLPDADAVVRFQVVLTFNP